MSLPFQQYWNESLTVVQAMVKVTLTSAKFPYKKKVTLYEDFCSCFVLYLHFFDKELTSPKKDDKAP